MRIFLLLGVALISAAVSAQDVLKATRPDAIVSSGGSTSNAMPLIQLVFAMLIVGGLIKFALPKMIPNLKNKFHSSIGSSIAIEETASFTGGQLLVVKARGRTFLLGSTAQNLTCLSELTESPESQEPAFFELVDKAEGKAPEFAIIETAIPENEPTPKPDIADQLSRLKRLIG